MPFWSPLHTYEDINMRWHLTKYGVRVWTGFSRQNPETKGRIFGRSDEDMTSKKELWNALAR
jgi:hypothetical protein